MKNKIVRQIECYDAARFPPNEENVKTTTADTLQRVAWQMREWDDFELILPATIKIEMIQQRWDWMIQVTLVPDAVSESV